MGQPLSKVSKRILMPKISVAIETHERLMIKDAMDDIAQKKLMAGSSKYSDPSAMEGFRRDTWKDSEMTPQEYRQKQFLQQNQAEQEMPIDLLKFLNETGPVTKKIDKNLTSPKVYESLQLQEEQRRQEEQQQRQRRRRAMPMIGDATSGDEALSDGTAVQKTTNFSTAVKEIDRTEIRFTDQEMFDLIKRLNTGVIQPDSFVKDSLKGTPVANEREIQNRTYTIENLKSFYAIPILMQDTDNSMIGAWGGDNINSLKLLGVRMAPDNVCLVMDENATIRTKESFEKQKSESRLSVQEFLRQSKNSTQ